MCQSSYSLSLSIFLSFYFYVDLRIIFIDTVQDRMNPQLQSTLLGHVCVALSAMPQRSTKPQTWGKLQAQPGACLASQQASTLDAGKSFQPKLRSLAVIWSVERAGKSSCCGVPDCCCFCRLVRLRLANLV